MALECTDLITNIENFISVYHPCQLTFKLIFLGSKLMMYVMSIFP
ncbi:unnamed protein product, partial [Vitis vinifera]